MLSSFADLNTGLLDEFKRLEQDLSQLLGHTAWPAEIRAATRGSFPPVNVGVTAEKVDVYLFAAGIDPKSIDLTLERNLLTIAGRREIPAREGVDYYRRERFSGEFRRVISLPEDVDQDQVNARYRDGVLQITVQRREAARPRQISIQ